MITLAQAQARIGDEVAYRCACAAKPERGTITSVNDHYVFVRYDGDSASKATPPEFLTFDSITTASRTTVARDGQS